VTDTDSEEHVLVQRAQRGDGAAVAALFRRHAAAVFRYFVFRVGDQATAQDLTSEVFLQMLEGLPRYVLRGAPFAAWLFRIAHDRRVDHFRRLTRRPTDELTAAQRDEAPGPETLVERRAEDRQLWEAMGTLTEAQKLVIQLRFIEARSLEETARILNKSTGAVKAIQRRALGHLSRFLKKP
jgi:RNA polymerase sigma-70 factor (ECF subfamily)